MDTESEIARFKWILFAGIVFLVTAYFSYVELKFALWGKTAEATITRTHETRSVGRRSRPMLQLEYQFTEANGTRRIEREDVEIDWSVPENGNITIQYLPGVANSSRLLGRSSMIAVYVFLGCLVWLGVSGFNLWREASQAVHGSSHRRKK